MKTDYLDLIELDTNLNDFFNKNIEKHLAKDEVLELKKQEAQYKKFSDAYEKLKYLAVITPKILWRYFKQTIPHVPLNAIFVLNFETIELFSQVKVVSVKSRLATMLGIEGHEELKQNNLSDIDEA